MKKGIKLLKAIQKKNKGSQNYSSNTEEDITYILNIPVGRQQVFAEEGLRIFSINKDWAIIKWEHTKEFYFVYLHKGFIVCKVHRYTPFTITGEIGLTVFKVV